MQIKHKIEQEQGNSVARDLPRTGSETNTTIFAIPVFGAAGDKNTKKTLNEK